MKRKYDFMFEEWSLLNELMNRPDKQYLLQCLDESLMEVGELDIVEGGYLLGEELREITVGLRKKIEIMSEEELREIFSMLPVDASLGISLYR